MLLISFLKKKLRILAMKVLYYYYYLFYTRILPDNEPNATVVFTLSFSQSLLVNGLINILLANWLCLKISFPFAVGIFTLLLLINYLIYFRKKKYLAILEEKPMFFSSHPISIIITSVWFIITSSFLFWTPIYLKDVLEKCN